MGAQDQSTPSWLARNNIMVVCPFCGSSDTVVDALAYESDHWVSCRVCGARGPIFYQNCPTPSHEYDKVNKPYLVTDQLIIGCMTKWNKRADLTVRCDTAAEKEDTAKTSNNNASLKLLNELEDIINTARWVDEDFLIRYPRAIEIVKQLQAVA